MIEVQAVETAVVTMDASARNLIIILGNKIKIGKKGVRKILISEEALEDYGKPGLHDGVFIIDIDAPNRIKG